MTANLGSNRSPQWKKIRLGEICRRIHQGINTTADKVQYQESGIPIIQAKHITSGKLHFDGARFVSREDFNEYKNKYLPSVGNILFSNIGTIGKSLVVQNDEKFLIAWNVLLIELADEYLPYYVNVYLHYLDRGGYFERLNTGNAAKFINKDNMKSVVLAIPPLPEQRVIAEILSTWDEAIAKSEQLIATLQERKKGLMQRLLTGEVRFPGFEGEWEEVRLQDVIEINYGKSPKEIRDENGAFPIFGTGGVVGLTNEPLCRQNSVIIGRKGSIDQPQLALTPYWAIDTTFYCTPKNDLDVRWLYYYLSHKGLARYNEGSTIPSLSRTTLHRLKLRLPSPSEQRKIANVLQECDLEIELHHQRSEIIKQQKNGLMQRLLTSEVRVKV